MNLKVSCGRKEIVFSISLMVRTGRDRLKSQHGRFKISEFSYDKNIETQSRGGLGYLSIQCFKDSLDKYFLTIIYRSSYGNYPALSQARFRCILQSTFLLLYSLGYCSFIFSYVENLE